MTVIELPWPPLELSSNARVHWGAKARATSKYLAQAYWLAKDAKTPTDPNAVLTITYNPPDRRRRDCQNMPAAVKAAIDGIAQAMGCDDSCFRVIYPAEFGPVVKGGKIVIEVGK